MSSSKTSSVFTFDKSALIPPIWANRFPTGHLVFNPTLTPVKDGYAMCYRVAPPEATFRSLATCRLTSNFEIVAGSVTALSDLISFACPERINERSLIWHADPRYQTLGDRLYVSWNDGGNRPVNRQFIMEMSPDGLTPAGKARELVLKGMERRSVEKNWMLFRGPDGGDYVVYSCTPHIILSADLSGDGDVICTVAADIDWSNSYSEIFGVMRGGAQPILMPAPGTASGSGDRFVSITHSSYKLLEGRKYEMSVYEFEAQTPFAVTRCVRHPVTLDMAGFDGFEFEPLNKDVVSVVYPCGALLDGTSLIVSYGINDENLAIARMPWSDIESALEPVETKQWNFAISHRDPTPIDPAMFGHNNAVGAPLYWWNSCGNKFDGERGERRFEIGNFGDIASRDIVEMIAGRATAVPLAGARKILSIGSVLHKAHDGDVVWGTGIKGTVRQLQPEVRSLDIRAVRGPLTLDFLRESGFDVSKVTEVFDPGCLVNELFADRIKTHDPAINAKYGPFRVVPHYRDDLLFRRMYQNLHHSFLTVDCTPWQMVEGMLGAQAVYSSSLHGVIFAESLGIPAYWLRSIGGEDGYKFYDYYYGTGRYNVKCFDTLSEAMAATPMPLPVRRPDAYIATFPHDVMNSLVTGAFGLHPGAEIKLSLPHKPHQSHIIGCAPGNTRQGAEGLWMLGNQAVCGLRLAMEAGKKYSLQLRIRPFNHVQLPTAQELRIILGGRICYELRWTKGDVEPRTVTAIVTRDIMEGDFLRLEVEATQAIAPSSLKVGSINEPITGCLQMIALSEELS